MPTLERINPIELDFSNQFDKEIYDIHMERYAYALRHLTKGNVLDLACGTGYGSHFIAKNISNEYKVLGVDSDEDAIIYANQTYQRQNVEYSTGNAYSFIPPFPVHNIITLETIEHLEKPEIYIKNISTFLQKGNRVIASIPITPSMDFNPFHLHDFTKSGFCKLFESNNFRIIDSAIQVQKFSFKILTSNINPRFKLNFKKLLHFYYKHPYKVWIRMASLLKNGFVNKYFIAVFEKHN